MTAAPHWRYSPARTKDGLSRPPSLSRGTAWNRARPPAPSDRESCRDGKAPASPLRCERHAPPYLSDNRHSPRPSSLAPPSRAPRCPRSSGTRGTASRTRYRAPLPGPPAFPPAPAPEARPPARRKPGTVSLPPPTHRQVSGIVFALKPSSLLVSPSTHSFPLDGGRLGWG